MKPEDKYIEVNKIKTRYWDSGGEGSTILLIHGLGGFIELWEPTIEELSGKYHLVALDLPGHGLTAKPDYFTYGTGNMAQFVHSFIEASQLEFAHVVGHSLGGAIAIRLAVKFPRDVEKLVLVSSAELGSEVALSLSVATVPLVGELLTIPSRGSTARYLRQNVYNPALITPEMIETAYRMVSQPGASRSFLKTLRANGNLNGQFQTDGKWLKAIQKPTLVIWGKEDRILPAEQAKIAEEQIPDVQVQILENCGHLPMLEHTQIFNEALVNFFN